MTNVKSLISKSLLAFGLVIMVVLVGSGKFDPSLASVDAARPCYFPDGVNSEFGPRNFSPYVYATTPKSGNVYPAGTKGASLHGVVSYNDCGVTEKRNREIYVKRPGKTNFEQLCYFKQEDSNKNTENFYCIFPEETVPGDYEWYIKATNGYGRTSKSRTMNFSIAKPCVVSNPVVEALTPNEKVYPAGTKGASVEAVVTYNDCGRTENRNREIYVKRPGKNRFEQLCYFEYDKGAKQEYYCIFPEEMVAGKYEWYAMATNGAKQRARSAVRTFTIEQEEAGKANLFVERVDFYRTGTNIRVPMDQIQPGDRITAKAVLKNIGNSDSGRFAVNWHKVNCNQATHTCVQERVAFGMHGNLKPGEISEGNVKFSFPAFQMKYDNIYYDILTFQADVFNTVEETNEMDNVRMGYIYKTV